MADAVESLESERHLDEVGVAGPLAHAVDRPLHPGGACLHRGDRGGRGEPEVVVAVPVHRAPSPPSQSTVWPTRKAAASGVAMPIVSTTTTSWAPASTAAS